MGHELHRQFPFVDYVCSGEAEHSFPALSRRVLARDRRTACREPIPGIVYRDRNGGSVSPGRRHDPRHGHAAGAGLQRLFSRPRTVHGSAPVVPTLLFETSRGCWWGAKSHCTFCGLNGGAWRSAARARVAPSTSSSNWSTGGRSINVEVVDNILDMKYFKTCCRRSPGAAAAADSSTRSRRTFPASRCKLLHEAGVQPDPAGIESLSDHVLRLMRKGTTALRNIQLLKWCKEYSVTSSGTSCTAFPARRGRTTPKCSTPARDPLPPASLRCGPIRLDRFSPYHNSPADSASPMCVRWSTYHYLYPFRRGEPAPIAYYFDFDYEPDRDPTGYAADVIDLHPGMEEQTRAGHSSSVSSP